MLTDETNPLETNEFDSNVTVAFINANSGERAAAEFVHNQLRLYLGEDRVFNLFPAGKPMIPEAKEFLIKFKPAILIVAGGDGTVSLSLDIADELRRENMIPEGSTAVAILPMGTGNDLSRTLGFGGGYVKPAIDAEKRFRRLLDQIAQAKIIKMDRWSVLIQKKAALRTASETEDIYSRREGGPISDKENVVYNTMMNYFSIGFDADIVKRFADFRNEHPELCKQRSINKLWYGCFSCFSLCSSNPLPNKKVRLYVDDKLVGLPSGAKALVVTNVTTYAGGTVLWEDKKKRFSTPDVGDGLLEVVALYGVWHVAGVRMGIRKAKKMAQGRQLRIVAPAYFAMQYDGEPMHDISCGEDMVDVLITLLSTTLVMKCGTPS